MTLTNVGVQGVRSLGSLPALGVWLPPKPIDRLFEEQPFF